MSKILDSFKKFDSYHDLILAFFFLYGRNDDDHSTTNYSGGYDYCYKYINGTSAINAINIY